LSPHFSASQQEKLTQSMPGRLGNGITMPTN